MPTAADRLHALLRLSEAVVTAREPDDVVTAFVSAVTELLHVDQVHVTEVSQDAAVSRGTVAASTGDDRPPGEQYVQVLDDRPSGVGRVVASGEPLHVPDARGSDQVRMDLVERFDVASLVYVPLAWHGEVRHVVLLISRTPREFTAEEIDLARTLANQAAAGLALLESERRRAERAERDAALARAARALNASLDLQAVLETLAREADLAVDGDMAGVYLGDGERGGVATAGHNSPDDWLGFVMRPGEGVAGQVLATGRSAITNAYQSEVVLPTNPGLRELQTAVAVPMTWGGELKGALSVGFVRMRRVTREDLQTLEAIADLATVACRNAEAFQQIEAAARTDALTGLLNHGALQFRLREEIARARRSGDPLSCLLLDLDDFKRINDSTGHLRGDETLQAVADVMRAQFRPYDLLARYGGDEFVAVLPRCDVARAADAAERLRSALRAAAGLDCSVGVSTWAEPLTGSDFLDRADRALLAAKRTGKARVAVSEDADPASDPTGGAAS